MPMLFSHQESIEQTVVHKRLAIGHLGRVEHWYVNLHFKHLVDSITDAVEVVINEACRG